MLEDILNNLSFQEERILSTDLLKDLKPLNEEDAFADYQKRTAIALLYKKVGQARHLLKAITAGLEGLGLEARGPFEGLKTWLGYIILQDMPVAELEIFFSQKNITMIFQEEIFCDLAEAVRSRLSIEYDSDARDALRERMYNALHNNESTLSTKNLTGDKKGSIGYWLKAYDAEAGSDRVEAFERVTFENKPEVQNNLTKSETALLRQLFDFYEWLKKPSDSLAGFEEDTVLTLPDKSFVLTNGILIDISPDEEKSASKAAPSQESAKVFPGYRDIFIRSRGLLQETSGNRAAINNVLSRALGENDALSAMAALLLLAQLRALDDALGSDQNLLALVRDDLKQAKLDDKLEGLRLNPTAPNFISRFLKIVLQDKLNIAEPEALDFSQKLAQLLALEGEKYGRIVVEDGKGGWRWNL